jgi:hypothetical protein
MTNAGAWDPRALPPAGSRGKASGHGFRGEPEGILLYNYKVSSLNCIV